MTARRQFFVYIIASRTRALYIGVTNSLERRVQEHKSGAMPGSAARYHIVRLIYFEEVRDVRDAIAREKQLKAWRREKKVKLIEAINPGWLHLAEALKRSKVRDFLVGACRAGVTRAGTRVIWTL